MPPGLSTWAVDVGSNARGGGRKVGAGLEESLLEPGVRERSPVGRKVP